MQTRYLTVKEAAEYMHISVKTAYAWVSERRLPYHKLGKKVLFDVKDIEQYMSACKVPALQCGAVAHNMIVTMERGTGYNIRHDSGQLAPFKPVKGGK